MRTEYGTMNRAQLIAPAIKLAEDGFILKQGDVDLLHWGTEYFPKQPNVAAIFLNHGKPHQKGEKLVQKQLAATLQRDFGPGSGRLLQGRHRRAAWWPPPRPMAAFSP